MVLGTKFELKFIPCNNQLKILPQTKESIQYQYLATKQMSLYLSTLGLLLDCSVCSRNIFLSGLELLLLNQSGHVHLHGGLEHLLLLQ